MNAAEQVARIRAAAGRAVEFGEGHLQASWQGGTGSAELTATKEGAKLPGFTLRAYNGGLLQIGWGHPVVVDLAGMQVSKKSRPIFKDHSPAKVVGHTTDITIDARKLTVIGIVSGTGPDAVEVVANAKNGFPWQASIGCSVIRAQFVEDKQTVEANGKTWKGPVYHVSASILNEVSFVALGGDDTTSALVASAQLQDRSMPESNTPAASDGLLAAQQLGAEQERSRRAEIDTLMYGLDETAETTTLRAAAIAGTITTSDLAKKVLAMIRATRPAMPAILPSAAGVDFAAQSEAALLLAIGRRDLAAKMGERVVEAANSAFRGDGLGAVVRATLERNGTLRTTDSHQQRLRAAFSNSDLPNILSNVANKLLLAEYRQLTATWRSFAAVRSTPDLKDQQLIRSILNGTLSELPPNGEMKHASLTDEKISISISTFAKLLVISRRDLINDDLGALQTLPGSLARMAMRTLNDSVWSKVTTGAAAHFTAPRGNYITGAGTVLSLASLQQAVSLFRQQKDAAGNLLDLAPAVLVVPGALEWTARSILTSAEIRDTTASTKYGTVNPLADLGLKLEVEPRLDADSLLAWYVFGPPVDNPLAVLFLNGVDVPTVETSETDFDTLGMQMRVVHDWGVALGDYRSGVKSKGAV